MNMLYIEKFNSTFVFPVVTRFEQLLFIIQN